MPAFRILNFLARVLLKNLFNVKPENVEVVNREHGPMLLMGNHSSVLDPFIVAIFIRRPVQYVISDSQIRSPFLSFLLGLVGVIPKTKVVADLDTVKRIVAVKRENGIIGIFPEGQSSWDGYGLPIVKATDKLVKSLKIPVYIAQIRGAYFTWPRWGRRFRRGEVRIFYSRLFDGDELKDLTVDEVGVAVRDALTYDAVAYQRERGLPYRGARQAEYLERALFVCPACDAIATLHSHGRRLTCSSCGYSVHFSPFGHFEPREGALRFETIREWNLYQLEVFRRYLEERLDQSAEANGAAQTIGAADDAAAPVGGVAEAHPPEALPVLISEPEVLIREGYKTLPLKAIGYGRLDLDPEAVRFHRHDGETWVFPVAEIEGINVQNNEHLEFYAYNNLYRVSTTSPRGNTYKWDVAVRHIRDRMAPKT
jgi:1-acyl-sn-glycerol-3-phosphate acyltransferase